MNEISLAQSSAIAAFRDLHASGCFVLPNPWDIGTAVYLQHLGFKALATTSAGFAFSRGLPDSVSAISRGMMLAHISEIVEATPLPVNADFQTGYADEPEGVAINVALCVATGVAGLSIEDALETGLASEGAAKTSNAPLYEFALAVRRIKAAREAIDASGVPAVLTARCEAWLVDHPDPFNESLKRLVAFAEAGADCLYAPGVSEPAEIEAIVKAVSPKPVNVLVSKFNSDLTVTRLADLGVRRISVGSAMACVAWGGFMRASRSIAETGSFESFSDAAAYAEINDLFQKRAS
ncbi:MAG TPA: isocitrate lyase/phosphoenolpyruvate mutase family protein [Pyrinomonadaceae bacterium]|jgi:2-methylisocitrate lyase-like PEP mutase family enzyme|nr:isocitrate lyase/phosphoenolpyruvate mutase family protein [Pyrinomonadaceae bacterium]